MKTLLIYALAVCACLHSTAFGQVTVWSDNFNNGCTSNCLATTWNGWTVQDNVGGTTGGAPNNWFVSCAEEGITPPGCGSGCVNDASLHVGANPGAGGDMGASFNETGGANATYRMAVSPVINATGSTGMTLYFDFIAYGSAGCADDRLQLRLSTDGGATWPAGYQYCLTSACCGACNGYNQARWTLYTLVLPAAFDNNPNIRIGFHWRNNGNGSGTDPSGAIDDIRITRPVPLAVDLVHFSAEKNAVSGTNIEWKAENETAFDRYELERSSDGESFTKIYTIKGNCTGNDACSYQYKDVGFDKIVYYRLKMIDLDGSFTYSTVVSVNETLSDSKDYNLLSTYVFDQELQVKISAKRKAEATFALYNIGGKVVYTDKDVPVLKGFNQKNIDLGQLSNGVYILKIRFGDDEEVLSAKVIKNK